MVNRSTYRQGNDKTYKISNFAVLAVLSQIILTIYSDYLNNVFTCFKLYFYNTQNQIHYEDMILAQLLVKHFMNKWAEYFIENYS